MQKKNVLKVNTPFLTCPKALIQNLSLEVQSLQNRSCFNKMSLHINGILS